MLDAITPTDLGQRNRDLFKKRHAKEALMKSVVILSLLTAVMLLSGGFPAPAQAQSPATDLKPTFISPTPGLYVNGWPAFTVSYPKEWEEVPLPPSAVFEAARVRPDLSPSPVLVIIVWASPLPLEDWAKQFMPVWIEYFTDIKILSDKPSQLKDGTPAREGEVEWVAKYDPTQRSVKRKENALLLATKRDSIWVSLLLTDDKGKIGEDLKRIAYSLTYQPDREEPVKVPSDVRAFLDMFCADVASHDVKAIMEHFSDRFRDSGAGKPYIEKWFRSNPTSPIRQSYISSEIVVTVFEAHGEKAYVDGFIIGKAKGEANALKFPLSFQQIINEHGEWKWFGNQK
jgi:hypothetical protein